MSPSVTAACMGSSPRVRGTRRPVLPHPRERGIIPACAGNTRPSSTCRRCSRDHPRVCGEHVRSITELCLSTGSSPRVRGTQNLVSVVLVGFGIIPACAGNTLAAEGLRVDVRDHHRVCGEHLILTFQLMLIARSSPRVRGTPGRVPRFGTTPRIIPACAGNTRACPSSTLWPWDHPRVCGEHSVLASVENRTAGSSPRVRGTLVEPTLKLPNHGIIPACAGNTARGPCTTRPCRDHPRVCGEHEKSQPVFMVSLGSSPRVRGTRHRVGGDR